MLKTRRDHPANFESGHAQGEQDVRSGTKRAVSRSTTLIPQWVCKYNKATALHPTAVNGNRNKNSNVCKARFIKGRAHPSRAADEVSSVTCEATVNRNSKTPLTLTNKFITCLRSHSEDWSSVPGLISWLISLIKAVLTRSGLRLTSVKQTTQELKLDLTRCSRHNRSVESTALSFPYRASFMCQRTVVCSSLKWQIPSWTGLPLSKQFALGFVKPTHT